jgi:hypothetical protein
MHATTPPYALGLRPSEAQGLSLRDVVARLGRHHSVIGKLEQDRRRIDVAEYVEYCLSLDLDPHDGLDALIRAHRKSLR